MRKLAKHSETIKALLFITFSLVAIIVLASSLAVHGKNVTYNDDYHKQLEAEYTDNVKDMLNLMGLEQAGVSLLKTIDPQTGLSYALNIHHRRIEKMDDVNRRELCNRLRCICFPMEGVTVNIQFI